MSVTPTGAAILAVAASGFGAAPPMTIESIGYGTGGPRPHAVLLRVIVGEGAHGEISAEGTNARAALPTD